MSMSGKVGEAGWSVSVETTAAERGFECRISVSCTEPDGRVEHSFRHSKVFGTEREAMLEGLREGMIWVEQKMAGAFSI